MASQRFRRFALALVGYLSAAYLALVLFLAAYGAVHSNVQDRTLLRSAGLGGPAVLVGLLSAEEETASELVFEDRRYYVVFPHTLREQAVWVVMQQNQGAPVVGRSASTFWAILILVVASLVGFWWYWFRLADRP